MSVTYFKIGTTDLSNLVSYKVGYKKLWASGSGRNLAGVNKSTLVGIFTKLEIMTGRLNETEMKKFLDALNVEEATVTYFDPQTKALKSESFYFGDIDTEAIRIKKVGSNYKVGYNPLSFSVIANAPRS